MKLTLLSAIISLGVFSSANAAITTIDWVAAIPSITPGSEAISNNSPIAFSLGGESVSISWTGNASSLARSGFGTSSNLTFATSTIVAPSGFSMNTLTNNGGNSIMFDLTLLSSGPVTAGDTFTGSTMFTLAPGSSFQFGITNDAPGFPNDLGVEYSLGYMVVPEPSVGLISVLGLSLLALRRRR